MPIPAFTIDGVLPPFVSPLGPGGSSSDLTPYEASPVEVVSHFGTTSHRRKLLRLWLQHRRLLQSAGIVQGFQWLDGSFVENKVPDDLDIVLFYAPPNNIRDYSEYKVFVNTYANILDRDQVKHSFSIDLIVVGLRDSPETLVMATSYYLGLFSHRRQDTLWKGMLRVGLSGDLADDLAHAELSRLEAAFAQQAQP